MRAFIGGLLKEALKSVYQFEKQEIINLMKIHIDIDKCLEKSKTLPYLITFINTFIKFFKEKV